MTKTITMVSHGTLAGQHPMPPIKANRSTRISLCLMLFALFVSFAGVKAQTCTMACGGMLNVSLAATCESTITYDMILQNPNNSATCSPNGPTAFTVTVMDLNQVPIPTSPVVTSANINETLTVKVQHIVTGNACWGYILVEDKLAPTLTCPPDVTLACTASTDPAMTGTASATDCSSFTLSHYDQAQPNGCNGSFSAIIDRTWLAVDIGGYTQACTQEIKLSQPSASSIQFPPNRDGIAAPALDCVNPNTNPSNTGFPTIGGLPIPVNGAGYCNMAVTYSDTQVPLCQNSYKIIRTWTVVSWCTGAVTTGVQIISVKDSTPPVLTCPADLTVGTTSSVQCKATINLPQVGITDNCSTNFSVTMNTPAGLIGGNGGTINNINPGIYTITYNVSDACNNNSSCNTKITVVDDDAPTVICDENTVVTLNNYGTATVYAQTFDDGSYDNCGPITLKVRRMVAGCGTQAVYGPTVKFCCTDAGADVMVQMQATDQSGNTNSCMVSVSVTDNSQPTITCPANVTINCTQDPTNTALTGTASATAGCGTPAITYTDVNNLNMCDVGTITRTWKATLANGNATTCNQTITSVDNTPVAVVFPPTYAVTGCVNIADLAPNNLPVPYNAPITTSDCELLAVNFTDQVFTVAPPACFKIVRTWKVINMCTYVPGGTAGLWEGVQIITVTDNVAPTFTCPANMVVPVGTNCKASLTLPNVTNIQDCSQSTTVSVTSSLGAGYGPFNNVNPGNYNATYSISDGCGNTSSCAITVQVKDDKAPTPYCKNGLVIEIMQSGMVQTWASDFNDGSFDNCAGSLTFSFSSDVANTGATFDCDDLGQNTIQMWVTDAAGNQDYCETFLIVQDNMNACNPPQFASVGGSITNEMGLNVQDVNVGLNDGVTPSSMTGADGNFSFPTVLLGGDYTVTPEKNANLLNGVTTFDMVLIKKHIIGDDTLNSPYKIIAADVNRSGSITTLDLVDMQKAILHMTSEFPNNESWRFVDAGYTFANPLNPLQAGFPEVYSINNFAGNMDAVDFIAVKIGDVNGNATPSNFAGSNDERSDESLRLNVSDVALVPGETYVVDFHASNFNQLVGYQFSLDFDTKVLDFQRFEKGGLSSVSESNFGFRLLDEGVITTSWNDAHPTDLPAGTVLFRLVFTAKSAGNLANVLAIGSAYTVAEAYFESGELLDVNLDFGEDAAIDFEVAASPNPFTSTATVAFTLPSAQSAKLLVLNAAGQVVKSVEGQFEAGKNKLTLHGSELPGQGTYFLRLQTASDVATIKLVLVR